MPDNSQPVTLDMSTAKPIEPPPPPSGTAVKLDMSTAIPLAPDGTPAVPINSSIPPAPDGSTASPATLAQRIRFKYPDSYNDLDDATLEEKVLAKHPEYSDLPRSSKATAQPGVPDPKKAVEQQMDDDQNKASMAAVPGGSTNVQPASNTALGVAGAAIGAAGLGTGASAALPVVSAGFKAVSAWAKENPAHAYLVYKALEAAIPGFKKMVGIGKAISSE